MLRDRPARLPPQVRDVDVGDLERLVALTGMVNPKLPGAWQPRRELGAWLLLTGQPRVVQVEGVEDPQATVRADRRDLVHRRRPCRSVRSAHG